MRIPLFVCSAATLVLVAVGPALAADTHLRGTIKTADGGTVVVHTREGQDVTLKLGSDFKVAGVVKASMADIKPGTFIGTANAAGPDGAKALEVVVFPEAMRGTGEGDYGWDLKPGSSMTNATVSNPVQGVDGQTVTLTYKGGTKKVAIPTGTPVVTIVPATVADLVAGATVFVASPAAPVDGMLAKGFVAVGKDGAVPPM